MKNTSLIAIITMIVLVVGYFVFTSSSSNSNNGTNSSDEVQKITLSMKNYNYYPNTINVKVGIPVEMTLDSSVVGCYRAFTIRQLGISKYSSNPSQKITFTPTEKGTYSFSCSMGMGTGTIIVE